MVVAILAGMLVLGFALLDQSTDNGARISKDWRPGRTQVELNTIRTALQNYHTDCGHYPNTSEGLLALIKDPDIWGWDGPYLTMMRPDPWGTHYQYDSDRKNLALFSAGPDGRPGTPDDLLPDPLSPAESTESPSPETDPGNAADLMVELPPDDS